MTKRIKCPDPNWFVRLAEGKVTSEQEQLISRHLESCEKCQAAIEKLNDLSQFHSHSGRGNESLGSKKFQAQLQEWKSRAPGEQLVATGYMDVMPWLEPANGGPPRIDEFEILDFVGRGGMGVVFKCLDTKLQRIAAVKLMSPQLLIDEFASQRFLREARAAASINHPNVVTVHTVNQIRGLPYLVMEFVDGCSLESRLKLEQPICFQEILAITLQTISGLAAAHQQGILHRDIKPANIMLDDHSKLAKITDFGLACTRDGNRFTQTGMLVGTPEYISPEQAAGLKSDVRSDLFSMGSVVYAMCCGRPPFSSSSAITTLNNVRTLEHRPISSINPEIPVWFVKIANQLLHKDPDQRFRSAAETESQLISRSHSEHFEVPAIVAAKPELPQRRRTGRQFQFAVGLFVASLLLAIGTCSWWYFSSQKFNDSYDKVVSGDDAESRPNENRDSSPGLDHEGANSRFQIRNLEEMQSILKSEHDQLIFEIVKPIQLDSSVVIEGKQVELISGLEERAFIAVDFSAAPAFIVDDGSFRITNVEIEVEEAPDEEDLDPLILCRNDSSLGIEKSILRCSDFRPCIELDSSEATITDSRIFATDAAIHCFFEEKNELVLHNTFVMAPTAVHFESDVCSRLEWERVTCICEFGLSAEQQSIVKSSLTFTAKDCAILAANALMLIGESDIETSAEATKRFFVESEIRGSNNLVSSNTCLFEDESKNNAAWMGRDELLVGENNQVLSPQFLHEMEFGELAEQMLDGNDEFLERIFESFSRRGADAEIVREN